eukprot:TRINITY_DN66726_c6_g1_i1.p1 TRINITY_DN66726_c6_g1~~TRINITY_DN66726_c6_g1_i1.p1  ORF type:complete len:451 (+),score=76.91 TRINITY_DN66726_c6_g1_i1:19-1371(+)
MSQTQLEYLEDKLQHILQAIARCKAEEKEHEATKRAISKQFNEELRSLRAEHQRFRGSKDYDNFSMGQHRLIKQMGQKKLALERIDKKAPPRPPEKDSKGKVRRRDIFAFEEAQREYEQSEEDQLFSLSELDYTDGKIAAMLKDVSTWAETGHTSRAEMEAELARLQLLRGCVKTRRGLKKDIQELDERLTARANAHVDARTKTSAIAKTIETVQKKQQAEEKTYDDKKNAIAKQITKLEQEYKDALGQLYQEQQMQAVRRAKVKSAGVTNEVEIVKSIEVPDEIKIDCLLKQKEKLEKELYNRQKRCEEHTSMCTYLLTWLQSEHSKCVSQLSVITREPSTLGDDGDWRVLRKEEETFLDTQHTSKKKKNKGKKGQNSKQGDDHQSYIHKRFTIPLKVEQQFDAIGVAPPKSAQITAISECLDQLQDKLAFFKSMREELLAKLKAAQAE